MNNQSLRQFVQAGWKHDHEARIKALAQIDDLRRNESQPPVALPKYVPPEVIKPSHRGVMVFIRQFYP